MIITEEYDDFRSFGSILQQLENQLNRADYTDPMKTLEQGLAEAHARFFANSVDPNGTLWEPLAASTVAAKGHDTILIDTKALGQSVSDINNGHHLGGVSSRGLLFGSDVPYGIWHMRGTSRMPARPWLGVDTETLQDGCYLVADHSVEVLKAMN